MAIDVSLIAVPIQIADMFKKISKNKNSEYGDFLFGLPDAFHSGYNDFGHPDRVKSKEDLQQLLVHYPNKIFENKYYIDTKRIFDVLDYLIVHHKNDENLSFFNDGLPVGNLKSGQGFLLKYWDHNTIINKRILLENIQYKDLIRHYNYEKMEAFGIYKINQIHKDSIKSLFLELKKFINHAEILGGFVIISKI